MARPASPRCAERAREHRGPRRRRRGAARPSRSAARPHRMPLQRRGGWRAAGTRPARARVAATFASRPQRRVDPFPEALAFTRRDRQILRRHRPPLHPGRRHLLNHAAGRQRAPPCANAGVSAGAQLAPASDEFHSPALRLPRLPLRPGDAEAEESPASGSLRRSTQAASAAARSQSSGSVPTRRRPSPATYSTTSRSSARCISPSAQAPA